MRKSGMGARGRRNDPRDPAFAEATAPGSTIPLSGSFTTPLPPLRLDRPSPASPPSDASSGLTKPSVGARARKALTAVCATATACGLVLASAFPLFGAPDTGFSAAAATPDQRLTLESGNSDASTSLFEEINAVEVTDAIPLKVSAEEGLVDPASLENSEVLYPFADDQKTELTDGFAYRTYPVEQFHDAQDFAAAAGTPIRVIASGVVMEAGFADDGCGFGLKLQHRVDNQTLTSRYCHMEIDSHEYQVGDTVEAGDEAGLVGNTGLSFGAHLHLALRLNGEPIDPMPYLAKKIDD